MKQDIVDRKDLDKLMHVFYDHVMKDDLIGHYFNEVIQLDLVVHLPVIVDFWENVLFGANNYSGNPMAVHKHINHLSPFKSEHFDRWVKVFSEKVNELFEGDNAERIKQRAMSIATIMKVKLVYGGISK
jgi:hemoglobin